MDRVKRWKAKIHAFPKSKKVRIWQGLIDEAEKSRPAPRPRRLTPRKKKAPAKRKAS